MESEAQVTHLPVTLTSNVTASLSGWAWQEVAVKDMRKEDQFRNEVRACCLACL